MRSQEFMTLGSTLVVLGIVFGEDRLIDYSFIGVGGVLVNCQRLQIEKEAEDAKSTNRRSMKWLISLGQS